MQCTSASYFPLEHCATCTVLHLVYSSREQPSADIHVASCQGQYHSRKCMVACHNQGKGYCPITSCLTGSDPAHMCLFMHWLQLCKVHSHTVPSFYTLVVALPLTLPRPGYMEMMWEGFQPLSTCQGQPLTFTSSAATGKCPYQKKCQHKCRELHENH